MKTISSDDLKAFLDEARRSGVYEMYYIVLATGLRRGELLGLKWDDVDFKNATIRIKRQVARIEGKLVEAPLAAHWHPTASEECSIVSWNGQTSQPSVSTTSATPLRP